MSKSPLTVILLLIAWGCVAIPIFLRMPLTNDAVLFDLEAEMLQNGSMLYRDILEPNLPGVIWIHQLVRSVGGPSSIALRSFDLLLHGLLLLFVYRLMTRAGATPRASLWTMLGCSVFYLSGSEWLHCQRDSWMLTAALGATWLRCRQHDRMADMSGSRVVLFGVLEGLVWGLGIWIKPYVFFAAVAAWMLSLRGKASWRVAGLDGAGLLIGGLTAGAAGVGWMVSMGLWPHFLEQIRVWNPVYFQARLDHWTWARFVSMSTRFFPWMFLHLAAIPVALLTLHGFILDRTSGGQSNEGTTRDSAAPTLRIVTLPSAAFCGVYLAWLGHSFFLQHLFDYVHAPGVMLAVVVCADWLIRINREKLTRVPAVAFAVLVVFGSPYLDAGRLSVWKKCIAAESSPELRDELALFRNPSHSDLEQVASWLESQDVKTGDVVCFNSDLVALYSRLKIEPPTRYIYLYQHILYLPDSREQIVETLDQTGHRFVVSDLVTAGMSRNAAQAVGPDGPHGPPPNFKGGSGVYPWSHPVVFRCGQYLVHEVSAPLGQIVLPGERKSRGQRQMATSDD